MQRVGKGRIELGSKAYQAGSFGCGQLENTHKSRGRLEQASPMPGLRTESAISSREFGCGRIAKRLQ
jgi:hypothetical protein